MATLMITQAQDDEVKCNVVEVMTVLTMLSQSLSSFSPLVHMLPLRVQAVIYRRRLRDCNWAL